MSTSYLQIGRHARRLAALAGGMLLAGCVHTTPDWDGHFGDTTRLLLAQQVARPQAARNADPVAGMDGRAARGSYERYQKTSSEPAAATAPLIIGSGR